MSVYDPSAPALTNEELEELFGTQEAPIAIKESMRKLILKAATLDQECEAIEESLKAKKFQLRELVTKHIPDTMAAAGTTTYKDEASGVSIAVSTFVSGSLPKDETGRENAIHLIKSYGAEDMVKKNFSIAMSQGMIDEANKVEHALEEIGVNYSVDVGVHASTLAAFAKERLATGKQIDLVALGLYSGRVAKITRAKVL